MSNLPHPLGDTNPGELFFPGPPDVTASDLPGAAGSRAVEFGEDGYSLPVNRGFYALAKNEEYMEARLESKVGRVFFAAWTPAGGNGDEYVFAGVDMFVGGADYLPETEVIRDALISVLDSSYNELIAGNGDKIVVSEILNVGKTASIVGDTVAAGGDDDGFYSGGATIHFKRVHPVTGAPGAAYTIPNGADVILTHAVAGNIDSLATVGTEHLMRDAWCKGVIRNAHEIHAGTFLRDGSRTAIANFDMDGHNLVNVDELNGEVAQDLDIGSAQDLHITATDDLNLNDGNLAAAVKLSLLGTTGFLGQTTQTEAIIPRLNANFSLHKAFGANRALNSPGNITGNDPTQEITVPATQCFLNGEMFTVDATFAVTIVDTLAVLVVDANGSLLDHDVTAGTILGDEVILAAFYYDSAGVAFTTLEDLRTVTNLHEDVVEVTVGDGEVIGVDFNDLSRAIDYVRILNLIIVGGGPTKKRFRIRVIGTAAINETQDLTDVGALEILGDGKSRSKIQMLAPGAGALHMFDCGDAPVIVKDISIEWSFTADQANDFAAFHNPGNFSIFDNVDFINGPFAWANGIMWTTVLHQHISIKRCTFDVTEVGVRGSGIGSLDDYADHVTVEDCEFLTPTSITTAIRLPGLHNIVRSCRVGAGFAQAVLIGHNGVVEYCELTSDVGSSCVSTIPESTYADEFSAVVRGNTISVAGTGVYITDNTLAIESNVRIENNHFKNVPTPIMIENTGGLFNEDDSNFHIIDNKILSCGVDATTAAIYVKAKGGHVIIRGNVIRAHTGRGIWIEDAIEVKISQNHVEGYTTALGTALEIEADGGKFWVRDNFFGAIGADQDTSVVVLSSTTLGGIFVGNRIDGDNGPTGVPINVDVYGAVYLASPSARIVDNYIQNIEIQVVRGLNTADQCIIRGNDFSTTASGVITGAMINHEGDDVIIANNRFRGTGVTAAIRTTGTFPQILNNIINGLKGRYTALLNFIIRCEGATNDSIVDGNIISDCGDTATTVDSYIIRVDGRGTVINNKLRDCRGALAPGAVVFFWIRCEEASIIANNHLRANLVTVGNQSDWFYGIYAAAKDTIVSGNFVNLYGAGSGTNAWGIKTFGILSQVIGNHVSDYSGWVSTKGVVVAGDQCISVGNITGGVSLEFLSAVSGVAIGNGGVGFFPTFTNANIPAPTSAEAGGFPINPRQYTNVSL